MFFKIFETQTLIALKTKHIFVVGLFFFFISPIHSQPDTIYARSGPILCEVVEVGLQTVTYTYPGEKVVNNILRTAVEKIVFSNGRVQRFEEYKAYNPVLHAGDFKKVEVVSTEGDILGLTRIGRVTAKAKGATAWSGAINIQNRAVKKLLIESAMLGGNVVLLTQQSTTPSRAGSDVAPAQAAYSLQSGSVYTNNPIDIQAFKNRAGEQTTFEVSRRFWIGRNSSDLLQSPVTGFFQLRTIEEKDGQVFLVGEFKNFRTVSGGAASLAPYRKFRLTSFDDTSFTVHFVQESGMTHNIVLKFK